MNDCRPILSALYNSPLDAISWSLRSLVCAAPGSRLIAADYSNIEGRVNAWLAGEEWKVRAFEKFDTITGYDEKGKAQRAGPDLYLVAASQILGIPVEAVSKDQRQLVGKPAELGLGFGGAVGAILTMMRNGAVIPWLNADGPRPRAPTLDEIAAAVRDAVPEHVWEDAERRYSQGAREEAEEILEQRRLESETKTDEDDPDDDQDPDAELRYLTAEISRNNRLGLDCTHWTALRVIVDNWRQSNARIVRSWRALEDAATAAIEAPGSVQRVGRVSYCYAGDFLLCRLPSGRALSYPYPRIVREEDKKRNWITRQIVFEGPDPKTKKWGRRRAYGGLFCENIVQATARDVLAGALKRLHNAGYRIVLHVHDEIVCEMPLGRGSLAEMREIMCAVEGWAAGLPVVADGWEGERYRK